jgi:glycosyl transferase family 25
MKIFIINLAEDVERRNFIRRQLEDFGLEYAFFPAIRGASLTPQERKIFYDRKKALLYRSRDLTNTDIGCSLSHVMIYRKMVQEKIPLALVLEDDVAFEACFPSVLASASEFMRGRRRSICLLSEAECGEPLVDVAPASDEFRIYRFKSGVLAHCYLLDLEAASALERALFPVHDVADCWARLARENVAEIFVARPIASRQKREQFGSASSDEIRRFFAGSRWRVALYKMRRIRTVLLVDRDPIYKALARARRYLKQAIGRRD